MNKWQTKMTVVFLMSVCSGWVFAGEHGWVTSIMHADQSEQVYRVQIYKVDPDASDEAQRDGTFWKPIIYREK